MTAAQLLELRALADRATPAPWFARRRHLSRVPNDSGMGATLPTNHIGVMAEREDAAFIAAARSAVPALLDEVTALRAEVEADKIYIGGLIRGADSLRAEHDRLRSLVDRWEALGKRHDIGLREAECVCTWEQGDSQCPAHPTCDECGCVACECKPTGALAELAR